MFHRSLHSYHLYFAERKPNRIYSLRKLYLKSIWCTWKFHIKCDHKFHQIQSDCNFQLFSTETYTVITLILQPVDIELNNCYSMLLIQFNSLSIQKNTHTARTACTRCHSCFYRFIKSQLRKSSSTQYYWSFLCCFHKTHV